MVATRARPSSPLLSVAVLLALTVPAFGGDATMPGSRGHAGSQGTERVLRRLSLGTSQGSGPLGSISITDASNSPLPGNSTTSWLSMTPAFTAGVNGGAKGYVLDVSPTVTEIGTVLNYSPFHQGGTLTNTGIPNGISYINSPFRADTIFQSNTDGVKPYLADVFDDHTTYQQTTGSATDSLYAVVSLLADPTVSANGGNYTLNSSSGAQVVGLWSQPNLSASSGKTFTLTTRAGVYVGDVIASGTVALTNNVGLYVDNMTVGTNNYSIYSLGTGVMGVHAGPVRIGDTTNPTQKLEVAGNELLTGTLTVQGNAATFGTAGTTFTLTAGGGGSGGGDATFGVNAGSSGYPALNLQRNGSNKVRWTFDGNTIMEWEGTYIFRRASDATQLFTLDQSGNSVFGTAGTANTMTVGQGTTGTDPATVRVRSGNSGTTAPSLVLATNTTDKAQVTFNGTDTFLDYTGTLTLRTGIGGATEASLSSAGNLTLNGYAAAANTATAPSTGYTVPTGYVLYPPQGTQRMVGAVTARAIGTARIRSRDENKNVTSQATDPGSITIASGEFRIQLRRLRSTGKARIRMLGNSTLRGIS